MLENEKRSRDLSFLPRALCAWLVCAAALLLCAVVLFASDAAPLSRLGYASSIISFFAALGAGLAACYGRKEKRLAIGLLTACCLIILLLLTGFLISGHVKGDAVLSMVSFTLTGCLIGSLLSIKRRKLGRFHLRKGKR